MRVWLLQRNEPTPHDNSGSQRILRTGIMARMLAEGGHEVVWWTSDFDHYNRTFRYHGNRRKSVVDGYEIQYLQSRSYEKNISIDRFLANKEAAQSFTVLANEDYNPPDIIIASVPTAELAWQAIEYAAKSHIPVLLDVRDLWPDHLIALAPAGLRPLAKLLLLPLSRLTTKAFQQATGILALTEPFLDWGLGYAQRKRNTYDRVVPMGYIKNDLAQDGELQAASVYWDNAGIEADSNHLVVSFIGTLGRGFDLDAVFAAARILQQQNKPVRMVICGDGEFAEQYRRQFAHLKNVIMPGWIDKTQIKVLLSRSDVGLLPYIDSENFIKNLPNKPAEYLSGGLLLASSLPRGPLCSLIDEYDCGFSYSHSVEYLAEKLSYYCENAEALQQKKSNALRAANERLNGAVVYREMIQFLENIVAERSSVK